MQVEDSGIEEAAVPPRRISQGRFALVGCAIAAVIAAAALSVSLVISSGSPNPQDNEVAVSDPSSLPTPAVSSPMSSKEYVANHTFKSQSGNLRCSVGTFSGEPGAICQQTSIKYAMPVEACLGGAKGVFIGLEPSGAYWPCVAGWREPAEVLPYDTPVTQSGVTCLINYDTGVTCTNEEGKGFTMEYTAGITSF